MPGLLRTSLRPGVGGLFVTGIFLAAGDEGDGLLSVGSDGGSVEDMRSGRRHV